MIGIAIREYIGIGDKIQFSSLPENYFRATGEKLIDVNKSWIFDFNPYVDRKSTPSKIIELWNWPKSYEWPSGISGFYQSNAHIWASLFGVEAKLIRPRLYHWEHFGEQGREKIIFHASGKSHKNLPQDVIDHVIKKYSCTGHLYQIGLPTDINLEIPRIETKTLWDLAMEIAQARMLIGIDSGPSWIAACYPSVQVKKIRNIRVHGEKEYKDWLPLERSNFHSFWDDRFFQIYHSFGDDDIGYLQSYKKI